MMSKSFQNRYAYYYDFLYRDKDYEEEVDFLGKVFGEFSKKRPETILDLACGTGGHAIPLAARGYKVSGLDLSAGMLRRAEKKAEELGVEIALCRSPLQKFSLGQKFDAVISMFSAINYLTTYEDLKSMFGCVRSHLRRGGLFYFDCWNGLAVLDHYDTYREKVVRDGDMTVKRMAKTRIDPILQLCWVNYHCCVYRGRKKIEDFKETHELKFFFVDELKNYLRDAGFEVLTIGPFLQIGKPITKKDWDINFVVRKN